MKKEIVYSPINDKKIKGDIVNSRIWKSTYKKEDLNDSMLKRAQ